MFWRIYFWFMTLILVIALGFNIYNWSWQGWDVLDYIISFLGLIPLFGFTYNREIWPKSIWKAYLPILVIWDLLFNLYMDDALRGTGIWDTMGYIIFFLLIVGPLYRGIYLYGYRGVTIKEDPNPRPKNLFKKIILGFILSIFTLFAILIIAFVIVTKGHEGGIRYTSTMESYAKEYIRNHKLIKQGEKVIVYLDDSLYTDGTESMIITNQNIMHHNDKETFKIKLEEVKEIELYNEDFNCYIQIVDKNDETLHVPFSLESEAKVFYKALKKQLQIKKVKYLEVLN